MKAYGRCLEILEMGELALSTILGDLDGFEELEHCMSDNFEIYEMLVFSCLELGNNERAWEYTERGKARALNEGHISFKDLVDFTSRDRCHILQFFVASRFCAIFKISPGLNPPVVYRLDEKRVDDLFHTIRQYLLDYEMDHARWTGQLAGRLKRICDLLDLNENVPDKQEVGNYLAIIPHRLLNLVPFGALRVRGKYLFEYFPHGIRIGLSCASLVQGATRPQPRAGREPFDKLFVVSDPNNDLPFARHETDVVERHFPEVCPLRKGDATLAAVLNLRHEIADSPIVHFACHARYNSAFPSRSQLILAKRDPLDIIALSTRGFDLSGCLLVCLSACETGVVNVNTFSDESFGIGWAFLLLKAHNVLCTFWEIDDFATALFMESYYGAMKRFWEQGAGRWDQIVHRSLKTAQQRLMTVTRGECMSFVREMPLDDEVKNRRLDQLQRAPEYPLNRVDYWAAYTVVSR